MNRTKKFFYNSVSTAIYQIAVMVVGFITPRVMLQYYGSELNGLVSSINQFIVYLSLVEAGIAGAAVYSLYKPLADNNKEEISSIVSATKKFYFQAGWIFTALISAMAFSYPFFVETNKLSVTSIILLVFALGAKSFMEFFTMAKYRVILTADQKTYAVSNASTVYTILQMFIIVILSVLHTNIVLVYTIAIVSLFVRSFILMFYVKKNYPYINYKAKPNVKALDKRWDALFLQVLNAAQTGAPVIIATIFTALTEVSVYTVYNMVFTGINGVLSIFINGLSAGFGDVIARKEIKTLQKSYQQFEYVYYILITIVYAVSAIMLLPFIKIYTLGVTDANYIQPLVSLLFTVNGMLYNLKTPQGMLVISAGLYKETRYRSLLQSLIIVVGGVALAPFFGIIGILIASCLSNLYRCIDLLFFIPKYVTKLPVKNSFFRMLVSLLIFTLACVVSMLFPLDISGVLNWIIHAIIITLIVTGLTLIINLIINRSLFKESLIRIKNMVKK